MSIPAALSALVTIQVPQAREILPPPAGYSQFQKDLMLYRKCYQGKLFDDDCRRIPWGQRYDVRGREIDRAKWKPVIKPAIAKIMAHTHSAYLVGDDRFPKISLVTKDTAPFPGLAPLEKVENPELAKSLAQKRALQTFLDELFKAAWFQQLVEDATLDALVMKEQPVLLRFYGGVPFYTRPDRLWCDWGYREDNPRELEWFDERYFFKRTVRGKEKTFYYQRSIDDTLWAEWEVEITEKTTLNADGELELGTPKFSLVHGLGFVPVTIVAFKESIFADEMVDNIKGYIEYRNNIMAGVSGNMDPQRVLLRKQGGGPRPAGAPPSPDEDEDDEEPLERGALWELEGDSIQSFANDTEGYKVAQVDIAESKDDLYQAARVIVIPADNEQSGKALSIRMAPQFSETQRKRADLGHCLVELVQKLVKGALAVDLELPAEVPASLDEFTVQLDWGQLTPVTPESIKLELENADMATGGGKKLLSERTARRKVGALFSVDDMAEEEEQIEREEAEAKAAQAELADVAFERANQKKDEDETDGESESEA